MEPVATATGRSRLARLAGPFHATLRWALDAALPPLCPSCREPTAGGGLCGSCWSRLTPIERPYCERLGIPFVYDPGPGALSAEAISDPPAYRRARAAVRFDGVARDIVHALKYGDRQDLAPMMGRWMARAGGELLADADGLVPVPLHWRRLWARRFNQSALLAQVLATAQEGLPVVDSALCRVKATAQQVGLKQTERLVNVQGAFQVAPEARGAVLGRRLVLVDDVLTSGATADACARALLRAGAVQVDVLVFARVVGATRTPI